MSKLLDNLAERQVNSRDCHAVTVIIEALVVGIGHIPYAATVDVLNHRAVTVNKTVFRFQFGYDRL